MEQDRRCKVTQRTVPSGPWFEALRSGNFDVAVEAPGHGIVNPPLDVQKELPGSASAENYGGYEDPKAVELYNRMLHETDPAKQHALMLRVREAQPRYRGAPAVSGLVVPHRAVPFLCQGLEDRPEPPRQPGPGHGLARQMR